MPEASVITIAVDATGGDRGPGPVLDGVRDALVADPHLRVLLVGPADVVEPFAAANSLVEAVVATECITMDEHPAQAVRSKKDSSHVVGCRLVRDGRAHGFFSAGNSGATMAAGTLLVGRIKGVDRPAIASVIPTLGDPSILLDIGANADCRPEHLFQFALMGSAYARVLLGVQEPRVGLLNIGEEPSKGSLLAQEAHALMTAGVPGFIGNVEGRDIPFGTAHVVVTDGFTGNVALKLYEGTGAAIFASLRDVLTANLPSKLAAGVLKPALRRLRDHLDPEDYGAAPLLGLDGLVLIGHGSSGRRAIASALRVGAASARGGLVAHIAEAVQVSHV